MSREPTFRDFGNQDAEQGRWVILEIHDEQIGYEWYPEEKVQALPVWAQIEAELFRQREAGLGGHASSQSRPPLPSKESTGVGNDDRFRIADIIAARPVKIIISSIFLAFLAAGLIWIWMKRTRR